MEIKEINENQAIIKYGQYLCTLKNTEDLGFKVIQIEEKNYVFELKSSENMNGPREILMLYDKNSGWLKVLIPSEPVNDAVCNESGTTLYLNNGEGKYINTRFPKDECPNKVLANPNLFDKYKDICDKVEKFLGKSK